MNLTISGKPLAEVEDFESGVKGACPRHRKRLIACGVRLGGESCIQMMQSTGQFSLKTADMTFLLLLFLSREMNFQNGLHSGVEGTRQWMVKGLRVKKFGYISTWLMDTSSFFAPPFWSLQSCLCISHIPGPIYIIYIRSSRPIRIFKLLKKKMEWAFALFFPWWHFIKGIKG